MAGVFLDRDKFNCPICIDILKDPVTVNCGHSYCMGCIKNHWDQHDYVGVYSCPQCRVTFTPRPVLGRNTILAEVVEKLKTELQSTPSFDVYAGPADVACDVCTERKSKAVKSCLDCLASYCETHLQLHDKLNHARRHKLTDAVSGLQDKICPRHDKLLEIYCRTDQQCVCLLCLMGEHRNHDAVCVSAGRTEKQNQLQVSQKEFQQIIQEKEKWLQELRQAVDSLKLCAQAAVEESESIIMKMVQSIERKQLEVIKLIRDQEKAAVGQAERLLERLELEIADLKRRDFEIEQLSHTQDHIHFLQNCQSLCGFGTEDLISITLNPSCSFENDVRLVSFLKDQLDYLLKKELVSNPVKEICFVEPKKREDFLQYACELSLDPNTVQRQLCFSEGNRVVTWVEKPQPYPDHQDRFEFHQQVLCREGLCGRCYWEAEWSGTIGVYVAVSYRGISRKGEDGCSLFGRNDKSWSLFCSPSSYLFRHNDQRTAVHGPLSSRIGVYLNYWTGTLSFYSVSDTMTLLHRVQTTFTQPLYPGFYICRTGTAIKLCSLENK